MKLINRLAGIIAVILIRHITLIFKINVHNDQCAIFLEFHLHDVVPASLSHLTSKKSENPTGSKSLFPIMPFRFEGAGRKGMLFDFSAAIMMVLVLCLTDWGTNAAQPRKQFLEI